MKKYSNPKNLSKPVGPYSHVAKSNGKTRIYVAGQIPMDRKGKIVGLNSAIEKNHMRIDLEAQVRTTLDNVKVALSKSGASMDDVVKLNAYVVISAFNEFRGLVTKMMREFFRRPYPPSTIVSVPALMHPEAMIEIEVMAEVG